MQRRKEVNRACGGRVRKREAERCDGWEWGKVGRVEEGREEEDKDRSED